MTQETALAILKTGVNVFLTGEPGSGKTHTINRYVNYLRSHGIEPAITASTGIAATHIGGMTVHSWSGIGIQKVLSKTDLQRISKNKRLLRRASRTSVLIIDEISMLDAQTLTALDAACQALKKNHIPFGGMQVVFVGDFFQLPPISRHGEDPAAFAYRSHAWDDASPTVCYLTEQHRQADSLFLELLASLRSGVLAEETHTVLKSRSIQPESEELHPRLYSHNIDVDRVNIVKLTNLSGAEKKFQMTPRGPSVFVERLIKSCLSPEVLLLKVGARVMFTKNNFEDGFVNGTLGVVEGFSDDGYPIVRTTGGKLIHAIPMEWTMTDGAQILAKIIQIPLRLAWAITVHKSQGMTLDSAIMDLSNAFEYGQGYVAISRVRTLAGLFLMGYNQRALEVHPEVLNTDAAFKNKSIGAERALQTVAIEEQSNIEKKFILDCGGSFDTVTQPAKKKELKRRGDKTTTYETTFALINQGKNIRQIAAARELTESTIAGHVEKLYIDGKLDRALVLHLAQPTLSGALPEIHKALKESEDGKLSPLFEKFKGRYSYGELRLARMLMEK